MEFLDVGQRPEGRSAEAPSREAEAVLNFVESKTEIKKPRTIHPRFFLKVKFQCRLRIKLL